MPRQAPTDWCDGHEADRRCGVRGALTSCLLLFATLPAIGAPPHVDGPRLRQTALALDVAIDYAGERLSGRARIEVENAGTDPAAEASLLLGRLMTVEEVRDAAGRALPARQAIVTYADSPKEQVDQALVALDPPLRPGERRTLDVRYSGYLVGYTETGMLYVQDHVDREFTILRCDAHAFPGVALPSNAANNSVERVDFPFELSATVDDGLTVANGGEPVERTSAGGKTTWRYKSRSPAPFLNVTIAPYELTESEGVRLYSFPKDHEGAGRVLAATRSAMALYRRWFGRLAGPARFAIIEIPDGLGSQASLTAGIIQTADVFRPGANLQPLYHEVSHFWNPPENATSCRWNEGLASYLQRRAAREIDGWQEMDADLARRVARVRDAGGSERRLATVPLRDYGKERMTDWSYSVGLLMFAVLDRVVGAEEFNEIVGGFYQEHRDAPTSCEEFSHFVAARGGAPAAALLADWFDTTRWWGRLGAGESLNTIATSYSAAGAATPGATKPRAPETPR